MQQGGASLTPNWPLGLVVCVQWDKNLLSERAAENQCLRRQPVFMSKKEKYMFKKETEDIIEYADERT